MHRGNLDRTSLNKIIRKLMNKMSWFDLLPTVFQIVHFNSSSQLQQEELRLRICTCKNKQLNFLFSSLPAPFNQRCCFILISILKLRLRRQWRKKSKTVYIKSITNYAVYYSDILMCKVLTSDFIYCYFNVITGLTLASIKY